MIDIKEIYHIIESFFNKLNPNFCEDDSDIEENRIKNNIVEENNDNKLWKFFEDFFDQIKPQNKYPIDV